MLTKNLYLPWTPDLDNVDVGSADGGGDPDGGHEGPGVNTGVPQVIHQIRVPALFQSYVYTCLSEKLKKNTHQYTGEHPTTSILKLNIVFFHAFQRCSLLGQNYPMGLR